ncbi:hypothetical protein [Nitrospirillum sp. BR 11828]|uniref:hypothetical protein n=1 Tax=Nitrospirillum sp. BR 11828 TaxID=3104325 RepID=UPI002ACAB411|nr:hypothetical protein [Nitrospirillum sp. BR 11828]MDZ5650249.1 hypothetical protein [Nitrospirillum sp. BR 11828]
MAEKSQSKQADDRTVYGSYTKEGRALSYTITVHGLSRGEASRVLSNKSSPSSERMVTAPKGPKRLGVAKSS